MEKSEFLDELRLEVGLAYDYAKNKDDFIQKVVCAIYEYLKRKVKCSLAVYEFFNNGDIQIRSKLGTDSLIKDSEFGLGFINLTSIRAALVIQHSNKQVLFVPIHENNCLKYVFKLQVYNYIYSFAEQDIDFINEVIRFIEVRQQMFIKDEKNK